MREVGTTRGWDVAVGVAAAVLGAFHMHASRDFWFLFEFEGAKIARMSIYAREAAAWEAAGVAE